jgi:rubredoxin
MFIKDIPPKFLEFRPMSDHPTEKTLAELAPSSYECRACGYVYDPSRGDNKTNVAAGVNFEQLPTQWHCPVCGASKALFTDIGSQNAPSGFSENLKYGFGVNTLTPSQKNLLIFGALALGMIFLLSLYGLQ